MKRRGFILLFFLFFVMLFASCNSPRRKAQHMLSCAEQLLVTFPDSTAHLIDSVLHMPVQFNEQQRMDMALLQAEALFGKASLDDELIDAISHITSPDLERAVVYYTEKKAYAKAAHAALYNGYVQQYYDNKAAAMQSFKDAEHYGSMVNDSLTMARAQFKMGRLLLLDGMKEDALKMLTAANEGFGDHYDNKALTLNMMAVAYSILKDYENAVYCLDRSLDYALKAQSSVTWQKVMNNYAVLYQQEGDYAKAINYLKRLEKESDDNRLPLLYLNLGNVYIANKQVDSASFYYHQLETLLPDAKLRAETLVAAYGALSRFAESTGNYPQALKYRKDYDMAAYEVQAQREQKNIYRIQKQYDYEALQNTMNRQHIHFQRIMGICVIVLFCAIILFLVRSVKKSKKEAEIKANLFHFMQQNKQLLQMNTEHEKDCWDLTQKNEEWEKSYHELILQNEENSKILKETLQRLSDSLHKEQQTMVRLDIFLKNKGSSALCKALEKTVFGQKEHWSAMMEVINQIYPNLQDTLQKKYPNLEENEIKDFILSYFRVSRQDEADLLGISQSVVDKLRTKTRKKIEKSSDFSGKSSD